MRLAARDGGAFPVADPISSAKSMRARPAASFSTSRESAHQQHFVEPKPPALGILQRQASLVFALWCYPAGRFREDLWRRLRSHRKSGHARNRAHKCFAGGVRSLMPRDVSCNCAQVCLGTRGRTSLAEVRLQEGEPLENALRRFKRKVQTEDIIKEVKRHSYYLKPGEKRRVKQALARKRAKKKSRKDRDFRSDRD
jgi:small subunit ribosomal protein S21